MIMNSADPFVFYYISDAALPKGVALSKISSGIFDKTLNVIIFNFLCSKFAKNLTWCLS